MRATLLTLVRGGLALLASIPFTFAQYKAADYAVDVDLAAALRTARADNGEPWRGRFGGMAVLLEGRFDVARTMGMLRLQASRKRD